MRKRKGKKFKEELYNYDPISMFLSEREYNQCFNKSLFSDVDIRNTILKRMPDLERTGREAVPFFLHGVPIISNLKVAAGLVEKGHTDREVGMILLYNGSTVKRGIAKKSGKPYELLSVQLSDGYSEVEASSWNHNQALCWNHDSLIFVRGTLREGWKSPVCINIQDISILEKESK